MKLPYKSLALDKKLYTLYNWINGNLMFQPKSIKFNRYVTFFTLQKFFCFCIKTHIGKKVEHHNEKKFKRTHAWLPNR